MAFCLLKNIIVCPICGLNTRWNGQLLTRLWRNRSLINDTTNLPQRVGEYVGHVSCGRNVILLRASSRRPPSLHAALLQKIPHSGPPSLRAEPVCGATVNTVKCPSCLNDLTDLFKPNSGLQVTLFAFCFYLGREHCCCTPYSEHWRQWSHGFHAVGGDQLGVLSLIHLNSHKQKDKQTPFRSCAIFTLRPLLKLSNTQWNQRVFCLD